MTSAPRLFTTSLFQVQEKPEGRLIMGLDLIIEGVWGCGLSTVGPKAEGCPSLSDQCDWTVG